jgi:hypothetical protein
MSYVKIDSWHIEREGDQTHTLCGLTVRAHPDPKEHEYQATAWAEQIPANQKTCETCLRIEVTNA